MTTTHEPSQAFHGLSIFDVLAVTSTAEGVTLRIDKDNEDYYLEVAPDHAPLALEWALLVVAREGLELMDEEECPSTTDANGNVRTYLAEVIP